MNLIFAILFIVSIMSLIFTAPENILPSILLGGKEALDLTFYMLVIYAFWLGIANLLKVSNLSFYLSRFLIPVNKFLFGNISQASFELVSLTVSANMLGLGGVATPMAIEAISEMEKSTANSFNAITTFFLLCSTSIQLLPTSVISLRASLGSTNPASIIFPSLIISLFSTVLVVIFSRIFCRNKKIKFRSK